MSNSGGTATYNNLDLSNGKTYFTVSGGTMNLEGGSFAADTDMFTVKGGTANVNGCTLALKNNSEKSKYNRYFFQLTGGETNLNGGALVADTGTKYPYVANGTGGTLKLDGELKYTKVEEGAVLRTMLAAPDNYKIALGDSFSSAAPITFRFEGISLDFADTVWTATQKKNFAMPKGYTPGQAAKAPQALKRMPLRSTATRTERSSIRRCRRILPQRIASRHIPFPPITCI